MKTECWVPLLDSEVETARTIWPESNFVQRDGAWALHVHSYAGLSVNRMVRLVQHVLAEERAGHALYEPQEH